MRWMAASKSLSKALPGKTRLGVAGAVELELVDVVLVDHVEAGLLEELRNIWGRRGQSRR